MKNISVGIIGGGIGGITTAVALRHFGIDATVYERAPELREKGAGMMLWANATRIMSELGLLDEVIAKGGRTETFHLKRSDGRIMMNVSTGDFEVPSVCLSRAELLSMLIAAFPAENVRVSHEFVSLEQRSGRVRVGFSNGEIADHDVLIGADGIRSRVRAEVFGPFEPVYRGYTIWRGIGTDVRRAMPPETSSETWGNGKRFGVLTSGGDRFTWYAAINCPPDLPDSALGRRAELLGYFKGWHAPIEDLIESTSGDQILKNGGCDHVPLRHWVRGRVALLGDSAHATTPNLGQGGGMAIEDAAVLAKALTRESSVDDALSIYERQRTVRTRHIQLRSRMMGQIGQWQNPLVVKGREIIAGLLPAAIFERNLRRTYSYRT